MLDKYSYNMEKVNKKIFEIIKSNDEFLDNIIFEYFNSGGKKIRPLLTLIFSNLENNSNKDDIIKVAAIIEIIHTTTLIHDDIIDKAKIRRNKRTLNNIYGNKTALMIGNYLFSRILKEVSTINNYKIHYYLEKTLKNLCLGELIQNEQINNINIRNLDYLKKIRNKTAILIAFSCVSSVVISNFDDKLEYIAYKFGYYLGMSYQVMDDYLDFVANEQYFGKEIGKDLLNGNITYPILLKIKKDNYKHEDFSKLTLEEKKSLILEIKNDKEILYETKKLSEKYLLKSLDTIENIDINIKKDLMYIVDKLYDRKK